MEIVKEIFVYSYPHNIYEITNKLNVNNKYKYVYKKKIKNNNFDINSLIKKIKQMSKNFYVKKNETKFKSTLTFLKIINIIKSEAKKVNNNIKKEVPNLNTKEIYTNKKSLTKDVVKDNKPNINYSFKNILVHPTVYLTKDELRIINITNKYKHYYLHDDKSLRPLNIINNSCQISLNNLCKKRKRIIFNTKEEYTNFFHSIYLNVFLTNEEYEKIYEHKTEYYYSNGIFLPFEKQISRKKQKTN